jgi:ribose 5-phosphate isomerase B
MSKKIAIGSDHAGFELKQQIIQYLEDHKQTVIDKGTYSEERADYPDYAHAVAQSVLSKEADLGVLMCGSGNGIAIAANRHRGIRAAIAWQPELASLARQHNAANVLVLPARFISREEAFKCVDAFLSAEFEGGRHQQRIEKIEC